MKLEKCAYCGSDAVMDWGSGIDMSRGIYQNLTIRCKDRCCLASVDMCINSDDGTTDSQWQEEMLADLWNGLMQKIRKDRKKDAVKSENNEGWTHE